MAVIDDHSLSAIRRWVGSEPSDAVLDERFRKLGTADAVAADVLQQRLADMLANPLQFRVDGDASWSYEKNVAALRDHIADLAASSGCATVTPPPTLNVGRLVRSSTR